MIPDGFIIDEAIPDDYDAIGNMLFESFSTNFSVPTGYEKDLRDLQNHARRHHIWIIRDSQGNIAGSVQTPKSSYVRSDEDWPGERPFQKLAVSPHYRGHGLGTALIGHALAQIQSIGFARVGICTGFRMASAVKLYESYGFKRHTEREWQTVYGGQLVLHYTYSIPGAQESAAAKNEITEPIPRDVPGSIPYLVKAVHREYGSENILWEEKLSYLQQKGCSPFRFGEHPVISVKASDSLQRDEIKHIAKRYEMPLFEYSQEEYQDRILQRNFPPYIGIVSVTI